MPMLTSPPYFLLRVTWGDGVNESTRMLNPWHCISVIEKGAPRGEFNKLASYESFYQSFCELIGRGSRHTH